MNRTIGDATVQRPQYKDHDQLRTHIADVLLCRGQQSTGLSSWALLTDNFARRRKTPVGLTPYE
ncbi:MAG: hypothetical protein RLZZ437_406 [Pseudomonadota bacterium]